MLLFFILATVLAAGAKLVMAQSVFAHVIVGNNDAYTVADWQSDISLAASKGIDAFVLNIATPLSGTAGSQSAFAFEAAKNLGASFKLFFSFDYEGGEGPWSTNDILTLLRQYGHDGSYFQYEGRPFVSTFEGPGNSDVSQWAEIRRALPGGIYFVPDWSSQGPGFEMPLYDGAFSWNMWPDGPQNMTTDPDIGWLDSLKKGGKSYMMGKSFVVWEDLASGCANEIRCLSLVLHQSPSLQQSVGLAR